MRVQAPAVTLDDRVAHGEAEPRAARTHREEWLEQARPVLGGDATARVDDLDHDAGVALAMLPPSPDAHSGAACAGLAGFFWGRVPQFMLQVLAPEIRRRFAADWWAHIASYASGFVGGVALWVVAYRKRSRAPRSGMLASS